MEISSLKSENTKAKSLWKEEEKVKGDFTRREEAVPSIVGFGSYRSFTGIFRQEKKLSFLAFLLVS